MSSNYLGIDYGEKRVGVAAGDDESRVAHPLVTLAADDSLMASLGRLAREHAAAGLVVGLPRGLDGQETRQTARARDFAASLESLALPVSLQDEAGTSELARERLGRRAAEPGIIDREAAAIILQDFLDSL